MSEHTPQNPAAELSIEDLESVAGGSDCTSSSSLATDVGELGRQIYDAVAEWWNS